MKSSIRLHSNAGRRIARKAALVYALLSLFAAPAARAGFRGFTPSTSENGHDPVDGVVIGRSIVRILPLRPGDEIHVDGRLDDDAWLRFEAVGGFREWNPDRGALPSGETIFKVSFDNEALYIALACLEKDPAKITGNLCRRDHLADTDFISVYIDPYHDRRTGYNFRVNPCGVQQDGCIYNDGDADDDWNAVWQAETHRDGDGWYAEMRIPFASIPYRPETSTWGFQVHRYTHISGEESAWVVWSREQAGFVSRFGEIAGLSELPSRRRLELLPYVVTRITDPAVPGPEEIDQYYNIGFDLRYNIAPNLVANATVQPDFGQVEADPALLNLTPFETFYAEKRPFFIEGNHYYAHPTFQLFYSRRIGTGERNSRIRYAGKLTGKTPGGITIAALAASTDVADPSPAYNIFRGGERSSKYAVCRLGKEFNEGRQRFHVMQTAVLRSASRDIWGDFASREAYTSGIDFEALFRDRSWGLTGSAVFSAIDHEASLSSADGEPANVYGSGGQLAVRRQGGRLQGSAWGRWKTGSLDLNDVGYLAAPDEINSGIWLGYDYTPDGTSHLLNRSILNFNYWRQWYHEDRAGYDLHSGDPVWSYNRGHRAISGSNINGWIHFRNFWELWYMGSYRPEGSNRWETRDRVILIDGGEAKIPGGGPLISEPARWGVQLGASSDGRRPLIGSVEGQYFRDASGNSLALLETGMRWNQSSAMRHSITVGYSRSDDDTQHIANFENLNGGVGGVSYVFGRLHRKTLDVTLRTSLLFSRNQSLEVYAQPYLTVGDFRGARELIMPDSYELEKYDRPGFDYDAHDFSYAALNMNMVYRWEFRPGSTLYLVWTHSRSSYAERGGFTDSRSFPGGLSPGDWFENEPENVFLVKLNYWLPL